jgi:predicted aldo/keto reductase-like oxidoreductase
MLFKAPGAIFTQGVRDELHHKPENGNKLSLLGYGCMALYDEKRVDRSGEGGAELLFALISGVNYFDCAYIYPVSKPQSANSCPRGIGTVFTLRQASALSG